MSWEERGERTRSVEAIVDMRCSGGDERRGAGCDVVPAVRLGGAMSRNLELRRYTEFAGYA